VRLNKPQLSRLLFYRGVPHQPGCGGDHRKDQVQFGVLFYIGLTKNDGPLRIQTDAEPIDHHFFRALTDCAGADVASCQRMPVRHEEKTAIIRLQTNPIGQRTVQMAKMQFSSWTKSTHYRFGHASILTTTSE